MAPSYGKRSMEAGGVPSKALKLPDSGSEDMWECPKCENMNYGGRVICNMRKCGAPKPTEEWVCECGNSNYAGRLFCNLRKCQLAKPGLKASELAQLGGGAAKSGGKAATIQPGSTQHAPEGSWTCSDCGNLNFPYRTHCNRTTCAKPRGGFRRGRSTTEGSSAQRTPNAAASPRTTGEHNGRTPPPGSWVCMLCNNVNFPDRTSCNARSCGQPRAVADGGPAGGKKAGDGTAPSGSWTCPHCNNVNWPIRTVCNAHNCGKPKDS